MDRVYLPFEKGIEDIDKRINGLKKYKKDSGVDCSEDINKLKRGRDDELIKIYSGLTPWETVQVARHSERPVLDDYLKLMVKNTREMYGDRRFADDPAMYTSFGMIGLKKVLVVGIRKRADYTPKDDTRSESLEKSRIYAGCPNPEGYRKALAKMKLAEKFGVPIVTLVDTPGAYPGIGAEERGQAEAIAVNMMEMSRLRVPIVGAIIGEGGSGGALGIGVANSLGMMEHAYYSVISPEGFVGIKGGVAEDAADVLKLDSKGAQILRAIEEVIKEPLGGAHRSHYSAAHNLEGYILKELRKYEGMNPDELVEQRMDVINQRAGDWMFDRTENGWIVKEEVRDLWKSYGTVKD